MSVLVQNLSRGLPVGLAGALLRDPLIPGGLLLATAGHVLGYGARPGDVVQLTPSGDAPITATLQDWAPALGAGWASTAADVALVRLSPSALDALCRQAELCPTGFAAPVEGEAVVLYASSGPIPGRLCGHVDAGLRALNSPQLSYTLRNALCWQPDQGQTQPGDSGAPLWNLQGQLLGLHAGLAPPGALGSAVATPIAAVLDWSGASLLSRSGDPAAVPVQAAASALAAAPLPGGADVIDTLARTLWGEAQGEGDAGMAAVAHVVFNRLEARRWWGADVVAVCRKPWQFGCWNPAERVHPRLLAVTGADAIFGRATDIARTLLQLQVQAPAERVRLDRTAGATHYHSRNIALPRWARGQMPCARIGQHLFYQGIA
jgi:hypothetical protein